MAVSGQSGRAMANWFTEDHHVVIPVVKHRLCVDYLMHNVAWFLSLVCSIWAFVAWYLSNNASPYFLPIGCVELFMVPLLWFGEYALGERLPGESYVYLVTLWWSIIAIIWTGSAAYVHIRQSTEFVEENWFALQVTLPIPFTTELDQKRFMTNNATTIFWLCLTAGLVLLQAVGEAWKGLGGMMRLVQLKFAIMLPELVPLVVLGSTTAAYSIWAAGVAVFALDVKDGTNVILWQAALGMLVVVGAAATFAMRARWGITFASHAVPALVFGFLSLVMMITSSIIYHRANGVDAFVSANWDTSISFLVPPEFAANSWDKYAMESQTPMLQAAMTGFLTSVLLLCSVGMHLRCASVLLSVGSDLYMSRSRSQALHAVLAEKLAASKGLLVTSANPVYRGVGDSAASRYSDNPSSRVADWDGEDGGNTAAPSAPGASTGSRLAPLLDANGISSGNASSAAVFGSPRGIGGKSFTFSRGSDPGTPIGAAAGTVSSLSARSPRAYGTLGSDYSGKTSFPPQSSDGYQSAVYSSASAFNGAATAQPATALSAMQARMAAMQQYKYLLDVLEKQTADLEKRVTAPSMGTFFRTLSHEFKTSIMATHKAFVLTVVAVVVIACVSIGAGLSPLHSAATCGVLARSPATRTYSLDFQLEFGTQRQLYADITIENMFPFGGINVEVEHVAVYPETRTDEATIELVAMAADEADLPSLAQLAGAVNLTDFVDGAQNSDDDVGGFLYLSVGLPRPDNADAKCLGLKIRFYTIVGTMFVAVKSGTRIVNVTGNALDLETNKGAPFAFQTLDVVTDTAPIVLNNIYTDRIGLSPTAGVAVTHIKSFSGDVWINFLLSNGLRVDTGGSIHTKTLGSFSAINCVGAVCNDVYLTTTGAGKIVVQGAFGAYNGYLSSEHGEIIVANAAVVTGKVMSMTSIDGPFYVSSMIMASNNETFVSSSSKISMSAVFTNRMYVNAIGDADVSITVGFLGSTYQNPGNIIFPVIPAGTNYSNPELSIVADTGDISVISLGTSPITAVYSDVTSAHLSSKTGNVKVELNGGINAKYNVRSDKGEAIVEIEGLESPLAGDLGKGGNSEIVLFSDKGNVQLSLLPSAL